MKGDEFLTSAKKLLKPFFEKYGFSVFSEEYNNECFGNAYIVAKSSDARIKITRDRSQVFVEFAAANKPTTWTHLSKLIKYINGNEIGILPLEEYLVLIQENYKEILDILSSERYLDKTQ